MEKHGLYKKNDFFREFFILKDQNQILISTNYLYFINKKINKGSP